MIDFSSSIRPDERILEYDIDKVIFEGNSPFQKIQIVHSKSLGNMLVLDELQSKHLFNYFEKRNMFLNQTIFD